MGREFAQQILESPSYRAKLKAKANTGKLDPITQQMLWHYAYGKPAETVNVTTQTYAEMVLASQGPKGGA